MKFKDENMIKCNFNAGLEVSQGSSTMKDNKPKLNHEMQYGCYGRRVSLNNQVIESVPGG